MSLFFETIPLDHLKAVDWKRAPLGAILQARRSAGTDVIGMRCQFDIGPMSSPCLLILSGDERGILHEGGAVHGGAIDLSSLLQIVVRDALPVEFGQEHSKYTGVVCEAGLGSGHLFIRAKFRGDHRVYVWLRNPPQGAIVGTAVDQKPPEMWLLGSTDVEPKPDVINEI